MDGFQRNKTIIRVSLIGIIVNALLATFKFSIGLLSGSIAILLDGINNFTDSLSSLITIIGTKLSSKSPDKKHPMGYGRIEYISAVIVSAIVLYAGISSAIESLKRAFTPAPLSYTTINIVILAMALAMKFSLGIYTKKRGKEVDSQPLLASGADALFDSLLSLSVLISALIFYIWHISLEAYLGIILSLFIFKSGIDMLKDTLGNILGLRADSQLSMKIKDLVSEFPDVLGVYDLFVTDYGPMKNYASLHIDVPDYLKATEIDSLSRYIQERIYNELGIIVTAIGIYSHNTDDPIVEEIKAHVESIISKYHWAMGFHGFYANLKNREIRFDVVLSFDVDIRQALSTIKSELAAAYSEYTLSIVPDLDISD